MESLKVFEFSLRIEYGGGVLLIAAKDEERAKELRSELEGRDYCGGFWEFDYEKKDLFYKGEEGIVTEFVHF